MLFAAALLLYFTPGKTGWVIPDEFGWRFVFFLTGLIPLPAFSSWPNGRARATTTCALSALLLCVELYTRFSGLISIRAITIMGSFAGALACIMSLAAFSGARWTAPLTYIGTRSLYVYLAFFFLARRTVALIAIKLGVRSLISSRLP